MKPYYEDDGMTHDKAAGIHHCGPIRRYGDGTTWVPCLKAGAHWRVRGQ